MAANKSRGYADVIVACVFGLGCLALGVVLVAGVLTDDPLVRFLPGVVLIGLGLAAIIGAFLPEESRDPPDRDPPDTDLMPWAD